MKRNIRVIMAKLGLDIHWRGVQLVSQFLKDAGMEVVYVGNAFPAQIVATAIQEDADVVGLSTLSGNHLTLGPKVVELLKENGLENVKVFMGGVIPPAHIPLLKGKGIYAVFGPDTPMEAIVAAIKASVAPMQA